MPVHKTKGGYKYGETGKTYKNKKDAIKQAVAIAYSKAREKGRKPSSEEVEQEISGNPDKITKQANMKNSTLHAVLYKQAAAHYNQYGLLLKVADDEESFYGPRMGRGANHYVNQRQQILGKMGYTEDGWGVRGKPREGFWQRVTPWAYGREKRDEWFKYEKDIKPGAQVSQARGDAIRLATAKRIAKDFAAGNADMQNALFDELMRRSEHNISQYKTTGKLRPDYYLAPNQTHIADNGTVANYGNAANADAGDQNQLSPLARRRRLRLQSYGINVNPNGSTANPSVTPDDARYGRKVPAATYQSNNQTFLNFYKNMDPETRRRFDTVSAGV